MSREDLKSGGRLLRALDVGVGVVERDLQVAGVCKMGPTRQHVPRHRRHATHKALTGVYRVHFRTCTSFAASRCKETTSRLVSLLRRRSELSICRPCLNQDLLNSQFVTRSALLLATFHGLISTHPAAHYAPQPVPIEDHQRLRTASAPCVYASRWWGQWRNSYVCNLSTVIVMRLRVVP